MSTQTQDRDYLINGGSCGRSCDESVLKLNHLIDFSIRQTLISKIYACLPCANFPPNVRHYLSVVDDSYSS